MADDVTSKGQSGRVPTRYQDPFQSFRTEMDRLFDSFLGGVPSLAGLRQSFAEAQMTPTMDVKENEKEIVVKADLPGMDERDINLTIHNGVLSFAVKRRANMPTSATTTTSWNAATVRSSARYGYPRRLMRTRRKPGSTRVF